LRTSPQNIINHILNFNKESINNILIKLFNINNEKNLQWMMLSQQNMMNPFYFQNMNYNMQNVPINMAPNPQNINVNLSNSQPFFQKETVPPIMYGFTPIAYNGEYYPNQDKDNKKNLNITENN